MSLFPSRLSIRMGWFRGARKLWNCLAFHLVVDDNRRLMTWTLAIPMIFTLVVETPALPYWMGAHTLAGGIGERAEYGFWHDYHETKLQWRKIINLAGRKGGWECRSTHRHGDPVVIRHESIITDWVVGDAQSWIDANHIDRWKFVVSTWVAQSAKWWIPSLYDHFFILHAAQPDGLDHEVSLKTTISKRLDPKAVFKQLTEQLTFS
jgi:hypothetical protein